MRKTLLKNNSEHPADAQWNVAIFLAIGFAALLTLGVVIYLKFSPSVRNSEAVIPVQSHIVAYKKQAQEKVQEKLPVPKESMVFAPSDLLKGTWVTNFGDAGIAKITIAGGLYEVILAQDIKRGVRKYSRGAYQYHDETGMLTLSPSQEYGEPEAVDGVYYKILTMRQFDIHVYQKPDDDAVYFVAPEKDVLIKAVHPMFLFADYAGAPVLRFAPVSKKAQ